MAEWLESIFPEGYAPALMWVGAALLLLVLVLLAIRVIRSLTSGTFIAGGRNRRARLAVMDATPVDSRRRLVLVRRDDVEHLILIGGPTDVVVERDIRLMPRQARPAAPETLGSGAETEKPKSPAAARPAEAPVPVKPAAHTPPRPAPTHNVNLPRPAMPMSAPPVAPERNSPTKPAAPAFNSSVEPPWKRSSSAAAAAAPAQKDPADLDAALAHELEVSLDEPASGKPAPPSIDDEMNRILGELSGDRR